MIDEVRWPAWPPGTYYALYNTSAEPKGAYIYGGVAPQKPGDDGNPETAHLRDADDNVHKELVWTFWGGKVYEGDWPRIVSLGEMALGGPMTGEGASTGITGSMDMLKTNAWYRMVMRAWQDAKTPENKGYMGWWMKDIGNQKWYQIAVVSIPLRLDGFVGNASFIEQIGPDGLRMLDRRAGYYRFKGQWHKNDKIFQEARYGGWRLIEDGTTLRFINTPMEDEASIPVGADNKRIFSITNQPPEPTLDPPAIASLVARRAGTQVSVTWQVPETGSPQLGYRIQAFGTPDAKGPLLLEMADAAPHVQTVRFDATGDVQGVRLVFRDVFDQEVAQETRVVPETPMPAQPVVALEPGLLYRYYETPEGTHWDRLPDFNALDPARQGHVNRLDDTVILTRDKSYGLSYSGYLRVPKVGVYVFDLRSCDGSRLTIDGKVIVNSDGLHSAIIKKGAVALASGLHEFRLDYFKGPSSWQVSRLEHKLWLSWEGPDLTFQPVDAEAYGCVAEVAEPSLALACEITNGNEARITPKLRMNGHQPERLELFSGTLRLCIVESKTENFAAQTILPVGKGMLWARLWYDGGRRSVDSKQVPVEPEQWQQGGWTLAAMGESDQSFGSNTTSNRVSLVGEGLHIAYRKVDGDFVMTARIADIVRPKGGNGIQASSWIGVMAKSVPEHYSQFDFGVWDTAGMGMRGVPCDRDIECSGLSRWVYDQSQPWVRIVRRGGHWMGYTSATGSQWKKVSDHVFQDIPRTMCVGVAMFTTPHYNKSLFGGTVSDISVEQPGPDLSELPAAAPTAKDLSKGRAVAIIADTTGTPRRLYLRTIGEGVRVSTDNGDTWNNLNTGLPVNKPEAMFVRSVAVHPTKPNILLLGGGCELAGKTQSGLWRSEDYGKTWIQVSTEIDFRGDTPAVLCGETISFDPDDPDVVIAGGDSTGLFTSHDTGKTWKSVGLKGERITVALFSPRCPNTPLIGTCGDGEWGTLSNASPRPGRIYQGWNRATQLKVLFERQGVAVNNIAFESMGEKNSYIYFATTRGLYYCFNLGFFYQYRYNITPDVPFTALTSYYYPESKRSQVLAAPLLPQDGTGLFAGRIGWFWSVEWQHQSTTLDLAGASCLAVSDQGGKAIFCCNQEGVFKSGDGAKSFKKISF